MVLINVYVDIYVPFYSYLYKFILSNAMLLFQTLHTKSVINVFTCK
nr:MAG TPA: hypothetical protein [Caudoviricetes sp.]DAO64202.1 MAG TPA: hypothetical protein [Bacteriophage sp.]DAN63159.1 MAG TPA: hypothetical protein [Caudoviricetes sp.]DAO09283.1 MAG TPA: hypothetical protein [Caudoviricetes sp.]DAO22614.1 MAG TPA: hypothetical protein [Caudoviricetes sp.]